MTKQQKFRRFTGSGVQVRFFWSPFALGVAGPERWQPL